MLILASALLCFAASAPAAAPGDPVPDLITALALQSGTMVPVPVDEGPPHSEFLSYTYLELGTTWRDLDEYDDEVRVWEARASVDVLDTFYLLGALEKEQTSAGHSDARILGLGLGAHLGLLRTLDIHADATWLYSECESDLSDIDGLERGWRAYGGARWIPLEWHRGALELHAGMDFIDLPNRISFYERAYGWEVGARLHYLELLSFDTTFGRLADDELLRLSVRLSF